MKPTLMKMDPEALYVQLGRLTETFPDLVNDDVAEQPETARWLGRAAALIEAAGQIADLIAFKTAVSQLRGQYMKYGAVDDIRNILFRALAVAELHAPAAAQGAFLPTGNSFDALAAVGKVFGTAKGDLMVIDPYFDEKILTDFAALAAEGVTLRLLADAQAVKPTLKPAAERWIAQHGHARPLECRLAPARSLHDRLIIVDKSDAWVLTQSFKDLAARAPASLVKSGADVAALKIPAFETQWANAAPI